MAIDFSKPFDPTTGDLEMEILEEAQAAAVQQLAPAGPLDLEAVKKLVVPYKAQVDKMVAEAAALKITDEASNTRAAEIGNTARKVKKAIEAIKNSPAYLEADEFLKGVRNLIKSFVDPLEMNVERVCKDKQRAWVDFQRIEQAKKEAAAREAARVQQARIDEEQRKLREEAERKAREAAELLKKEKDEATRIALQKTIEDETAAAQAPAPEVVAPVIPEAQTTVRTEAGSSFQKRPWKHEIVDESLIPRKYLAVNETLIRRDIAAGIREIPGVKIFQETQISYRG
jgi:hypothetical protein